jgi:hypothetical protein
MSGSPAQLYEQDFVRWTEQQAAALRQAAELKLGANLPLDWENLAEEIDDLGRSLKHELRSRLLVILEHLLKLQHSPAIEPRRGWIETIARERVIIEDLLEESPSLNNDLGRAIDHAKSKAARLAAKSQLTHGEAADVAPPAYTRDQVLGDWFPGDAPDPGPLPASGERA